MAMDPSTPPSLLDTAQSGPAWPLAAWRWLTAPSPHLVEPDQRRQAQLLSSILIIVIALLVLTETVILILLGQAVYGGFLLMMGAAAVLFAAYLLSRTVYYVWAALLTNIVISAAILAYAVGLPQAVIAGILSWLLIPLLLAGTFLPVRQLLLLWFACMIGVFVFPILVPVISFTDLAVNSLPFVVMGGAVVLLLTRHRDQLERDRAASIRRGTLRTAALLRVAERLNSLLDLELVLATMCEEVARVLEARAAIVFLYDDSHAVLSPAGSHGLPLGHVLPVSISRAAYTQMVDTLGPVATIPPGQVLAGFPRAQVLAGPAAGSVAFATLAYEGGLVGVLFVIGPSPQQVLTEDERLLLRGLADQSALAIVNTRLYKDARRRLERLQALRTIDIAITSNSDIQTTLDVLLEQITHQLDVDAALVLLLDVAEQRLVYAAGRGFRTQALQATRLRLGEGRAGQAALQRRILVVPDLAADLGTFTDAPLLGAEGFVSYFAAPLIAKGAVYGVLEVFHRASLTPGPEWLDFLEALAGQAAIAIDNTTLLSDLQRSHTELALAYDATIEGWSHALDLRDKETEGHTQRVTEMTLALARQVGRFDEAELVHMRRGALLHDIGKMGVPDSILLKPGPLSDAEWVIMRQHPVLAYEMLRVIEYLRPALDIPYCHHEKWDGTGYPRGLQGEQIPLAARLFAIVDIWDALRSDRPYRLAWPEDKVRTHLAGLAGSHLDAGLLTTFLTMLATSTGAGKGDA